jgi:glycosyltransferase involved in cell wall biosynthesis
VKNVLHLCESSETGGAESVLISIVENLDQTRYASVVCLLSEGWLKTQLDRRRIETFVIPQPRSFDLSWLIKLGRLLRHRQIHVMHSHEFATNVYASMLGLATGIPVVATVHGKNYYADRVRRRAAYRFVARHARMVAVSHDLKRFLIDRVLIPDRRITVVHNGIDIDRHIAGGAIHDVRRELAILPDQPVIGTVGNLFEVKGQEFLLRACKLLLPTHPDFVLLIAGEGGQLHFLQQEARELGVSEHVKLLGFRDDVPSLLRAMNVFVLPSLSEGLPLSILEALALEVPVVATNVGGIPEVIEDRVTGFLVPPASPQLLADRIAEAITAPEKAFELAQAGRKKVQEVFGVRQMVERYESLYEECL